MIETAKKETKEANKNKEAEVKKESAQPVLPETKAQKAANPRLSFLPKKKVEGVSGRAYRDWETDRKSVV